MNQPDLLEEQYQARFKLLPLLDESLGHLRVYHELTASPEVASRLADLIVRAENVIEKIRERHPDE